jgi:acyl carrier protein
MSGDKACNGVRRTEAPEDLLLVIRTVLSDWCHRPLEEVTPDTNLTDDLGVDSMGMIEINIAIEERLPLTIPNCATPDEIDVRTVKDLAGIVAARLTAQPVAGRR